MRLRWTGAPRRGGSDSLITPRVHARRKPARRVYGLVIAVMVMTAIVLQYRWMSNVRATGAEGIVPNTLAEKLGQWMLMRRGISLEDPRMAGQPGVEQIQCDTCMASGELFGEDGQKVMCPVCLGVGFRMVRRFEAGDRICPLCAGMGRVEMFDTGEIGTCPRCEGRGLVSSTRPDVAAE